MNQTNMNHCHISQTHPVRQTIIPSLTPIVTNPHVICILSTPTHHGITTPAFTTSHNNNHLHNNGNTNFASNLITHQLRHTQTTLTARVRPPLIGQYAQPPQIPNLVIMNAPIATPSSLTSTRNNQPQVTVPHLGAAVNVFPSPVHSNINEELEISRRNTTQIGLWLVVNHVQ